MRHADILSLWLLPWPRDHVRVGRVGRLLKSPVVVINRGRLLVSAPISLSVKSVLPVLSVAVLVVSPVFLIHDLSS